MGKNFKTRSLMNERWRDKIQASQIINCLNNHVKGTQEMSSTQIQAANILLRKCVPDLQAIDMTSDVKGELKITWAE